MAIVSDAQRAQQLGVAPRKVHRRGERSGGGNLDQRV